MAPGVRAPHTLGDARALQTEEEGGVRTWGTGVAKAVIINRGNEHLDNHVNITLELPYIRDGRADQMLGFAVDPEQVLRLH